MDNSRMDKNVEAVREMLKTRAEVGLAKYGVTTERSDICVTEWLQHLQEELMDACVYIQRIKSDLERSEVHISHSGVAVDQHYHWQPMETCPKRVKVQLLTQNGVAVYGSVDVDMTIYAGWAPLPKKPV